MTETPCEHDWAYEQRLTLTYPPVQRKICTKCLGLVSERSMTHDDPERFRQAMQKREDQQDA